MDQYLDYVNESAMVIVCMSPPHMPSSHFDWLDSR
jgi:hypothetical protein